MSQLLGERPNDYSRYVQEYEEPSAYAASSISPDGAEVALEVVSLHTASRTLKTRLAVEPVYVLKADGEERLVYNSNMMKKGVEYPVVWNGKHFILVKSDDDISVYERGEGA